ncbi:hypothetical protein PSACC_03402 [Paramicrosporidium saccamoebae]|uniref:Uncharacterized protein n=1 Tax=Paramicrosporidium saccamoebae TaxID=1246581 RepID=A0A2H9TG68_9FUNG|nr:hypothetical protein PSACC_03402 [Paramicrosporidium saccamoebae]
MLVAAILEIVERSESKPVIVGLCGPQGCGKSTLCELACDKLRRDGWNLDCVSLDDYYLPHESLLALRDRLKNPLYEFRGNPGTHDVELLFEHLNAFKHGAHPIVVPTYDKHARGGLGDRNVSRGLGDRNASRGLGDRTAPRVLGDRAASRTLGDRVTPRVISLPLDILLVEGWMVGFQPCESPETESATLLNESLRAYQKVWGLFSGYIFLRTRDLSIIYRWRWEQELNACRLAGTHCRSKATIDRFVDQFMPAYKLFYHVPPTNSIILELDFDRKLTRL